MIDDLSICIKRGSKMLIKNKVDMNEIDFIFFDKGGTLSYQDPHADDGVEEAKNNGFLGYTGDAANRKR